MTFKRQFTPQKGTEAQMIPSVLYVPFCGFVILLRGGLHGLRFFSYREAELHLHVAFNLAQDLGIVFHRLFSVFPSLSQALAFIRKPGATLLHRSLHYGEIEQIAFTRNSLAVHNVEFSLAKWRRHFVLRHFHFRAIAGYAIAVFDRADTTNIESQGRIELERATAGRRFRIAKHHSDLLADLIDEDETGV